MTDDGVEYEVVWSGGPGLTSFGPQRPGAVVAKRSRFVTDTATTFQAKRKWHDAHNASLPHGSRRLQSIGFDVHYDTGAPSSEWGMMLVERMFAARWHRRVHHDRRITGYDCEICGKGIDRHVTRPGGRKYGVQVYQTVMHKTVCQSCYVRLREARDRWPGTRAWRAFNQARRLTPADRRAARVRNSQRSYARQKEYAALGLDGLLLRVDQGALLGPAN